MPSIDKDHSRTRRGRHVEADAPAAAKRQAGPLHLKYVGLGLLATVLICCWQFLLLTRHGEPGEEHLASLSDALWVHESNITALASQQNELVSLAVKLSEQVREQQGELDDLRSRLHISGVPGSTSFGVQSNKDQVPWEVQHYQDLMQANKGKHQQKPKFRLKPAVPNALPHSGSSSDARWRASPMMPQLRGADRPGPAPPPPVAREPPAPARSDDLPAEWLSRFTREELEASAQEAERWRFGVRNAFQHVWRGYRASAWGKDEFKPVTGQEGRRWGGLGLMILDSLSTMWVMGLMEEFDEATRWVESSLHFEQSGWVSFFETTIRALGGLISAHSLSGRGVFLRKAQELADRMMPAFAQGDPGFPMNQVNLGSRMGKHGWYSGAVLSEAGSVQLEFRYISQQTGDPSYQERADRSMRNIIKAGGQGGLVPWGLSRAPPVHPINSHITLGAMGDSYYEYLLKMYVQTGRTEDEWSNAWRRAMKEMHRRLVRRTAGGLTYLAEENNGIVQHKMDHLACFVGGMLIYGSRQLPVAERDPQWEQTAAGITETCYEMYNRQPSHLAPEAVTFNDQQVTPNDMEAHHAQWHCLLRPEAAEAIFYMFYYTGDPRYRRMAGLIFEAIESHARTHHGYSAVADVRQAHPALRNEMETFFLAETLKYLYLTFVPNPREVLNLDEFVLNTEAHPIRIFAR